MVACAASGVGDRRWGRRVLKGAGLAVLQSEWLAAGLQSLVWLLLRGGAFLPIRIMHPAPSPLPNTAPPLRDRQSVRNATGGGSVADSPLTPASSRSAVVPPTPPPAAVPAPPLAVVACMVVCGMAHLPDLVRQ